MDILQVVPRRLLVGTWMLAVVVTVVLTATNPPATVVACIVALVAGLVGAAFAFVSSDAAIKEVEDLYTLRASMRRLTDCETRAIATRRHKPESLRRAEAELIDNLRGEWMATIDRQSGTWRYYLQLPLMQLHVRRIKREQARLIRQEVEEVVHLLEADGD